MDGPGDQLFELELGHQQMREHIAENDRLIGEACQRLSTSRALTGAAEQSGSPDE